MIPSIVRTLVSVAAVVLAPCSAAADCYHDLVGGEVRCDRASFTGLMNDLDVAEAEQEKLRDEVRELTLLGARLRTDADTAMQQARLTMQVEIDWWRAYATQQAPCPPLRQATWWDRNRPELVFVFTSAGTGGLVATGTMIGLHKDIKVWGPTLGVSLLFESIGAWAAWSN